MSRIRCTLAFGALILLVASCGGSDGGATSTTSAGPRQIHVEVSNGQVVTAESRVVVDRGTDIAIDVVSDVADEVHVHGYDLMKDVEAGGTVEIDFTADLTGIYEVELENAALTLFELEVR